MKSTIDVQSLVDELSLEVVYAPSDPSGKFIESPEVSRPGLILSGFTEHFDPRRIQIIGLMEQSYLERLTDKERKYSIDLMMRESPDVIAICRGLEVFPEMLKDAEKYGVFVLRTEEKTSDFMSAVIAFLNLHLAPMTVQHGELLEVFGMGVMIIGDSGVGKSETAIELINRGHRLVADDIIELSRVSSRTVVGKSPENTRHFMELRGIGIVNIRQLYGMGAVITSERIDLVIKLENWDPTKNYSKIGMIDDYMDVLGLSIPSITIPVRPGRNLAVIIEVAVKNFRNKQMGYDAEKELLTNLGFEDDLI